MDYRCTPLLAGYSPSKLRNGLQSYGKIDVLLTSPAHQNHGQQSKEANKSTKKKFQVSKVCTDKVSSCYALYCEPQKDKESLRTPVLVAKVFGPEA